MVHTGMNIEAETFFQKDTGSLHGSECDRRNKDARRDTVVNSRVHFSD